MKSKRYAGGKADENDGHITEKGTIGTSGDDFSNGVLVKREGMCRRNEGVGRKIVITELTVWKPFRQASIKGKNHGVTHQASESLITT